MDTTKLDSRKYTAAESAAIAEKLMHGERAVKCPRCGRMLKCERRGNSTAVFCPTEGCIRGGIRGL